MLLPHDIDGSGDPPVVLIPGANGHRRWMSPLAREFAAVRHTLSVTLPGEPEAPGRGPDPRDAPLDEIVARLVEILDARRLARPVICGTSFGGIAALSLALAHPKRVAALVLHATTARPAWRLRSYRAVTPYPLLAVLVFNAVLLPRLPAEFRASLPDRRRRWQFYREILDLRRSIPFSAASFGRRLRLLAGIDLTPELARVQAPTLVLSGEAGLDPIVGPEEGEWITAHAPPARHEIVPRTGHLAILARPDLLVDRAERFLSTCGLNGG
jgi:pimeloyl-ACP methyl ester carboxylesterase